MSSRKKPATKSAAASEPTRAEKAAFVKAMLKGIPPGTAAAKKTQDKRAGEKPASASKTVAVKKTAAAKKTAAKKTAPKKVQASQDNAPKVEILRKISAPAPVTTSAKSAEAIKLAKEIEKALEKGDLDFLQPHAVQALVMALCKFYAANDEADNIYPVLPGRLAVSGTDAMVMCGALLRAVDLQVFELGMFQSWSGR